MYRSRSNKNVQHADGHPLRTVVPGAHRRLGKGDGKGNGKGKRWGTTGSLTGHGPPRVPLSGQERVQSSQGGAARGIKRNVHRYTLLRPKESVGG